MVRGNLDEEVWDVTVFTKNRERLLRPSSRRVMLLARKGAGKEAKLSYSEPVLMENRNGLVVDVDVRPAYGRAEREAAFGMVANLPGDQRVTVGADKNYGVRGGSAGTEGHGLTSPRTTSGAGAPSTMDDAAPGL